MSDDDIPNRYPLKDVAQWHTNYHVFERRYRDHTGEFWRELDYTRTEILLDISLNNYTPMEMRFPDLVEDWKAGEVRLVLVSRMVLR
jgi:hypothetical protein